MTTPNIDETFCIYYATWDAMKNHSKYDDMNDVWDHQQEKINHLKEENKKLIKDLLYIIEQSGLLENYRDDDFHYKCELIEFKYKDLEHKREE